MSLINELLAETSPRERQRVHDRMMLAVRIADTLVEKGWTQKQLANAMGKRPSEISKWLSGTHNFTMDTLSDLSVVLGTKFLCVKEEVTATKREVFRFQTMFFVINRQQPANNFVAFDSFQQTIGQIHSNS